MGGLMVPRGASLAGALLVRTADGAGLACADGSVLAFTTSAEVGDLIEALAAVQLCLAVREEAAGVAA